MKRLVSLGLVIMAAIAVVVALPGRAAWARPASPAHPLGNFSVNQAIALDLHPDRIAVAGVVDLAELPTLQARSLVDANGDGTVSARESAAYNGRVCDAMARQVAVRVDGHRVRWSVHPDGFAYRHGSAGLHTVVHEMLHNNAASDWIPAVGSRFNEGTTEIHTLHTEVEGRSKAELFGRILDDWRADGVGFVLLSELAREALAHRDRVPVRALAKARLAGRGGHVATGWPELAAGPA